MLKTYRIIPLAFILFLFGFTLISVSPVIAEDSPEFVACQQIKPSGDFQLLKEKKNCFRDVARALQDQSGNSMRPDALKDTSLDEVARLNAKMTELETQLSVANAAQEPLNAKVAELETQVSAANAAQEPLNAKVEELETKVATLTTTNAQLQQQLNGSIQRSSVDKAMESMDASITELVTKNASLEQQLIALSVNSAVTSSDPSVSYADQIRATIRQILPLCQSYMIDVEKMNKIYADPGKHEYVGSGDERDKLYQSALAWLRSTEDVSNLCTNQVFFTHDELRGK